MSGRVTARSAVADLSTDARDANESSLELNKNIGPMDGDSANDYLSETSSRFIQRRSVRLDSDTTTIDLEETALRENCKCLVKCIEGVRDGLHYVLTPTDPVLLPAHHTPLFPKLAKRKRRLPWSVRVCVIALYLIICVALLLVLFFFNTYAAVTSFGKPARLDCWDGIEMINNTKFTVWGDPKWVPIRCPAYCKYRGDKNATVIGNMTTSSVFSKDSALCEAALEKGFVSNLIGGCAIVRVRPLDKPVNGVLHSRPPPVGSQRLSNAAQIALADQSLLGQQQEIVPGDRLDDDNGGWSISQGAVKKATSTTVKTVTTEITMTTSEVHTTVPSDRGEGNDRLRDSAGDYVIELGSCESKHCYELSFTVLVTALLMVIILLLFSPPKSVFYAVMMIVGYWYVVFVVYPTYNEKGRDRVDDALGTFSTFLVFLYAIYRFAISITMFETYRAVYIPDTILLFVLPFFFMLHMSYVKPFLDFSLTIGGLAGLSAVQIMFAVLLTVMIITLALTQFYHVYRHGLLTYYLFGYGVVVATLLTITLLVTYANGLTFHLHHYQLSLLLLPLVRFQTRYCVLCSGALLGMFVNGVACYGFDSTWVLFDPQRPGPR